MACFPGKPPLLSGDSISHGCFQFTGGDTSCRPSPPHGLIPSTHPGGAGSGGRQAVCTAGRCWGLLSPGFRSFLRADRDHHLVRVWLLITAFLAFRRRTPRKSGNFWEALPSTKNSPWPSQVCGRRCRQKPGYVKLPWKEFSPPQIPGFPISNVASHDPGSRRPLRGHLTPRN